jgi:hypothetical protein
VAGMAAARLSLRAAARSHRPIVRREGRVLNEELARSQIIGSAVMGIGMTLLE